MSLRIIRNSSFRTIFFLLLLVVLVPTVLIQTYIHYDRLQVRRAREYNANLELARAVGRSFEAFVQGVLQQELAIGVAVTAEPPMQAEDLNRLLARSAESSPLVRDFYWVGPDGRIVASHLPAATGRWVGDRDDFLRLANGEEWVISDLLLSEFSGRPVFRISRCIRNDKREFLGMVSASVIPEQLSAVLPTHRAGDAGISLIDSNGMLIYRFPELTKTKAERNWLAQYPILAEALKGFEIAATVRILFQNGERRLFGFVPVFSLGWIAGASRSEQEILRPIYAALYFHSVLFLIVALAAFATAWALSLPIAGSIERLRSHAKSMGQGEITHLQTNWGPSELNDLAGALNGMAEKIRLREAALRESELRYRELVQNADSAIIRWRSDGTIVFFNEFAQSFFGYSESEAIGRHIGMIVPEAESTGADLTADIVAHPESYRNHISENIRRDGSRVWMAWTNRPIPDKDGGVAEILAIGSDITRIKKAEDARRESEKRFRTVVDNLSEGLFIHALSGRIIYHNKASLHLHGFEGEWPRLSTQNAADLWEITTPDGRPVPFEKWLHHRVLKGERIQNALARVRRRDGRKEFWGSYSGVPIYDEKGRVQFALVTVRDVTDRVQAENELRMVNRRLEQIVQERTSMLAKTVAALQQANQQLDARAKQLAALAGELTMTEQRERRRLSQVLHDGLQQHLAAAKMQIGAILARIDENGLNASLSGVEATLAESIRMSRSLSADLSPPALHAGGLSAGLHWLARRMREQHDFQVHLSIEEHPDLAEDVKILVFESVRELLFNAFKHADTREAEVHLTSGSRWGIKISVIDKGKGFDPELLNTTGEGGGGFGLFSIRERLALIGGSLRIDSAPGKGCRFILRLPYPVQPAPIIADMEAPAPAAYGDAERKTAGIIRVLLADDHTLFRDGIARLLDKEPDIAVVGQAKDGREAVEMARKLNPHIILMDINMPNLNGIEATRIIHREAPGVRIIGLSMHEEEERARDMIQAGAAGYKNKTCPVAELVATVRTG
jgi:PAS domain S-box-containing protein